MCIPVAAAAAGIGTAFQIGSAVAANKAQSKQAAANRAAARRSFAERISDINLVQSEVRDLESRNIFTVERQARALLAQERLSQGESGVTGISARAVESDILRQASEATRSVQTDTEERIRSLERQKAGARTVLDNRLAGAQGGNPFLLGLEIAGATTGLAGSLAAGRA